MTKKKIQNKIVIYQTDLYPKKWTLNKVPTFWGTDQDGEVFFSYQFYVKNLNFIPHSEPDRTSGHESALLSFCMVF